MPEKKHLIILWRILLIVLIITGIWAFFRFLFPLIVPFVISILLARIMEPAVKKLKARVRIPRPLSSAILTIFVIGSLAGLTVLLTSIIFSELNRLMTALPNLMAKLPNFAGSLSNKVDIWIEAAPVSLQDFLRASFDKFLSGGITIPSALYTWLVNFVSGAAASFPQIVLFLVASILSTFFISAEYPKIAALLVRPFSQSVREKILIVKDHFVSTLGKWLKAQLILIAITCGILLAGLFILKVDYAAIIAIIAAIMDALPVIGVGMLLIPWAIFCIFSGNMFLGIGLLIIFAATTFVRGFVEPKLIGKQIGLPPLATLMSMYIGFMVWGILGMILFPLISITLKQMYDWGWLRFSKTK